MSNHPIVDTLNIKFSGTIASGAHSPNSGSACILEVCAAARGLSHTDSPTTLGMPDIRPINDAFVDPQIRTLQMVRLGVALWDYPEWSDARKLGFSKRIALAFIREILPQTLESAGLPDHANACREATDLNAADAAAYAADAARAVAYAAYAAADAAAYAATDAADAAYAAYAATDADAAYAAYAAAYAAADAAYAADAVDKVLTTVVDLWIRCTQESK